MVLLVYTLLQSNKKEKEAVPTETKNDKELEMKPVALESSEKPKLQPQLQPQPPSSPARSESRRSGGKAERGVKRCLKNKPACDKATTDSVGVKAGAGDGSATTSKPVTVTGGERQPQEPSAKRTIVRLPKPTKEATLPADRDSVKSTVANGKAPHTHLSAGRSLQTQRRDGDNRAERLGSGQEQKPEAAVTAASQTNKTQVRKVAS